ncbi:DUF72 domain-containing protein [Hyphomicrobium sp.]|uniref:DUF72 domain-containing protein n=1 Tax=Hyphomicrobium sp. TaxID=82 RepID=UPI0025C1C8F6|nr:DUF72 domain-containing protein [Hyphomicrobium sp.]MCC7253933.1 DUF72 domain-containing protein [Hyphomicrobium sp.]
MSERGTIRAGIGGWTFEPWRGVFYPEKLAHAKELAFASRALPSIEINGTYYRSQTPATFAKWAREVPDGFVFSVKGPRFATNRRVLAEAGESVQRFLESGVTMLGDRLGPILWQFAPTKKFDAADFGAFLALLPESFDGRKLKHTVEVRHASFKSAEFIALVRRFGVPVVYADHPTYPAIADPTGDFVYARLQKGEDEIATCYPPEDIADWAAVAATWAEGGVPARVAGDCVAPLAETLRRPRDVFVYFIHGGKMRAPAAAQAFMAALGEDVPPSVTPSPATSKAKGGAQRKKA